jgi:lysophospholipase L1-like esterase
VTARRVAAVVAVVGLVLVTGPAAPNPPPLRPDGAVTVFIAGDSIAAAYAVEQRPRAGWGQALGLFLAEDVRVRDEAWPGASTRTFVEDGRLDRILAAVEPGDYLVVSFGHNDQVPDERHTDPATGYRDHLRLFVERARAAGASPVLVTPVERRRFDAAGHAVPSLGDYPAAMAAVAEQTGTPLVDLHAMSLRRWDALGPAGTREEFLWLAPGAAPAYPDGVQDGTHFQAAGAVALARMVARDLQRQRLLAPRDVHHLRDSYGAADLAWPAVPPVAG